MGVDVMILPKLADEEDPAGLRYISNIIYKYIQISYTYTYAYTYICVCIRINISLNVKLLNIYMCMVMSAILFYMLRNTDSAHNFNHGLFVCIHTYF